MCAPPPGVTQGQKSSGQLGLNKKNQLIRLVITDNEKWRYLAVKNVNALPRGITSNHNGDFHCINRLHSCRTKNNFKKYGNACKDYD